MLEQPPLLTVRRAFARPTPSALEPFRQAEAAQVSDALGGRGALGATVQHLQAIPFVPPLVGPALTCETGPGDVLAALASLEAAQPGDVLLIATGGWTGTASIGDLFAGAARNAGIVAIVTDGAVRDVDGLARAGVPVFAAGLNPASPSATGPGTVGLPITIGGVGIDAGDVVVCDRTGVVVVPQAELATATKTLGHVLELEAAQGDRVATGQVLPETIRELLASDRVRYVD